MPKIRTLRTKKAPAGFEDVEPVLTELNEKLKEAVNESHEGKRKNEAQWPIFRIEHQMSRYIYELFWRKKQISRELYDWLCEEKYVNQALISKWRKPGYERLCCMKCIQPKDSNFGTTCICRVPQHKLHNREKVIECQHCGCRGCASGDQKVVRPNNTKSGAVITSGGLEAAGASSSSKNRFLPYGGRDPSKGDGGECEEHGGGLQCPPVVPEGGESDDEFKL